jgi:hypothetical protein
MDKMNEIFVAVKDVDYIETKIGNLCEKYKNRCGVDYVQQRALFRNYCYDTVNVFEDCFETSMLGMQRCVSKVKGYQSKDDLDLRVATFDIVEMLCELRDIVRTMVPIKDLPSCRKLIELSAEDIVSNAKDLVKNDVVKAVVGVYLLGSKVNDVVKIEDVKGYYSERLAQLNSEIRTKGKLISPIEQFLLDKFNAEIGYCNIALLKAGIGAVEELKDLVEIGKMHIGKYEKEYRSTIGSERVCL